MYRTTVVFEAMTPQAVDHLSVVFKPDDEGFTWRLRSVSPADAVEWHYKTPKGGPWIKSETPPPGYIGP